LALQERSLVTCTILTALAREPEQRFHFAAARRLGVPREKILEMITHAAHYAGWPNAVGALRSLNEAWPEE
jgi:4-carboxymuconolactone decarboxylase